MLEFQLTESIIRSKHSPKGRKQASRTKDGYSCKMILSYDVGGYGILFTWDSQVVIDHNAGLRKGFLVVPVPIISETGLRYCITH